MYTFIFTNVKVYTSEAFYTSEDFYCFFLHKHYH